MADTSRGSRIGALGQTVFRQSWLRLIAQADRVRERIGKVRICETPAGLHVLQLYGAPNARCKYNVNGSVSQAGECTQSIASMASRPRDNSFEFPMPDWIAPGCTPDSGRPQTHVQRHRNSALKKQKMASNSGPLAQSRERTHAPSQRYRYSVLFRGLFVRLARLASKNQRPALQKRTGSQGGETMAAWTACLPAFT